MADRILDVDPAFAEIEQEIETLDERIARCDRAIVLSRGAVWLGAGTLALVLTIIGSMRTPQIVFSAITAVLGGLVWLGASQSSRRDLAAERYALAAKREKLFDIVAARNGWADLTPTVH